MNIQQFYQKSAGISLNASLVALVPPFFLLLFGIIVVPNRQYIILIIPFLLYSFFCYLMYLLNARRSKEVSLSLMSRRKQTKLLNANEVIITFLPAPSLRMVIFGDDGKQLGEIRDVKYGPFRCGIPYFFDKRGQKKYGLYGEVNQLVATFVIKKSGIEIMPHRGDTFFLEKDRQSRKDMIMITGDISLTIKQATLYMDYQVFKEEILISRLRRGWLPIEWGKRFIDPNSPVLTFSNTIDKREKLMIFAVLAERFRYSDY